LHKIIADKIESFLPPHSLIRDEACGGRQRIPLFNTAQKSRKTEYCNVDLLVLKQNKIKMIVEIEESNVKPTQICGNSLRQLWLTTIFTLLKRTSLLEWMILSHSFSARAYAVVLID
jgi:hypothetical protein